MCVAKVVQVVGLILMVCEGVVMFLMSVGDNASIVEFGFTCKLDF